MIMKRFGYKSGIIFGLLCFAAGCFLFVPAANAQSYDFFLFALFVIACGLTTLETAANPYATVLGDPETGPQRLNFAQSFNGLAAALAPVVGREIILTKGYSDEQLAVMTEPARKLALATEASSVKGPYMVLGAVLVTIAIVFALTKLPKISSPGSDKKSAGVFHTLKHRHLAWAVTAQFFYVGAQVCVFSLFILYAGKVAGITEFEAAGYLSAGALAFLVGRFIGTALMLRIRPERLLAAFAAVNIILCVVAASASGLIAVYTVIAICFFMSIMFPTIFALGIKNLGADTEYGSSLIIMSIVGGAILPPVFGLISDRTGNIQLGYLVPLVCFAIITVFGMKKFHATPKEVSEALISHI
jgi:FHS family L-fucose permease-like MFS transporter